jgi:aspartyl-tRNA(Asn)/glutamyl-tRNA(Gln) amidotransferase subunit A
VGIKPTYGLVSTRGVIPLSWSRDHVGPLTRTVADAAIILEAIAGHDPEETTSAQIDVGRYSSTLRAKTASLRVGVCRAFFFDDLQPDVEAAIKDAIALVRTLTAGTRDVTIPVSANRSVTDAEAYTYHAQSLTKTPELYQPFTRERLRMGSEVTTVAYIEGRRELVQLRHDARRLFTSVDVLVTPTAPIPARTIADARTDDPHKIPRPPDLRNTAPFNINGLPSMSIPCGFTREGLPIGLQITGPPAGEAVVFQLGHAFEQATEFHRRRPPMVT